MRVPLRANPEYLWRRLAILSVAVVALALLLAAGAVTWVFAPEGPPLAESGLLREPLSPFVLAAGLWVIALLAESVGRHDLAWLLLLLSALAATGRLAAAGSRPGATVYVLLLLWSGPSVFRFHYHLLHQPFGCLARAGAALLSLVALVLSVPLLVWRWPALQAQDWYAVWRTAVTIPPAVAGGLAVLFLAWERLEGWAEARLKHVRLIAYGSLVACAPLLVLSLLPAAWGAPLYVPLRWTSLLLLAWPVYYLHALAPVSKRFDEPLRRLSTTLLVATVLLAGMLLFASLLHSMSLPPRANWPFLALFLVLGVWLAREPLWTFFERLGEETWQGRGASYAKVVGRLAESLSATLEPGALRRALVHKLSRTMHISWVSLFLRADAQTYALAGSHGLAPAAALDPAELALPADGLLAAFMADWGRPATHAHLRQALRGAALSAAEQAVVALEGVVLWVPLMAGGVLHGLLLIGPRPGSDFYAREDLEILTTLGHQSGVAIQNTRLVMEVQASRQELARAHQQLLDAGEQERLALARELHDGAVQQLIGISYQLVAGRRAALEAMGEDGAADEVLAVLETTRQETLEVVSQIRSLIGELRPPGLEDLGLVAALRSYVSRVRQEQDGNGPTITLRLDVDDRLVPGRVALCLFRVAQEGLRNALRHAEASHIDLSLTLYGGYVELVLVDDGRGFVVPGRLSEMAAKNHFGMVSMSERVAQVGGIINIISAPGAGTELRVQVALAEGGL